MHAGATTKNFDLGTDFVKKGDGFEGALAGTDNDYALIRKTRKARSLRSVGHERRRNMVERRRARGKRTDAAGNDDARSSYVGAILKCELKFFAVRLNPADPTRVYIRDCGTLIPQTVVNKALKGDRGGEMIPAAYLVSVQGKRGVGVGNVRCGLCGTKEHSGGHGSPPETHRLSKDRYIEPLDLAQVRSGGESVRPCPNDGNIEFMAREVGSHGS